MAKFFGNLHAVLGVGFVAATGTDAGLHGPYVSGDLEQQAIRWLHTCFSGSCGLACSIISTSSKSRRLPTVPADELKPGVSASIYRTQSVVFLSLGVRLLTVLSAA